MNRFMHFGGWVNVSLVGEPFKNWGETLLFLLLDTDIYR
jgi:hypothetical protein